jgi:hypothetical protein
VGGDFAEDVAGEDAHSFAVSFDSLQVYPAAERCSGIGIGNDFLARQLADGLGSPSSMEYLVVREGGAACAIVANKL